MITHGLGGVAMLDGQILYAVQRYFTSFVMKDEMLGGYLMSYGILFLIIMVLGKREFLNFSQIGFIVHFICALSLSSYIAEVVRVYLN